MKLTEKHNIWNCINYSMLKLKNNHELSVYWNNYALNNQDHKLFEFMGWQGGTIHQFIQEIIKLKKAILNY